MIKKREERKMTVASHGGRRGEREAGGEVQRSCCVVKIGNRGKG